MKYSEELKKYIPLTETTFLILFAMLKGNHGYGVLQMIDTMTEGRVVFGPGTLYGAINNLSKKGWIELIREDKENRRKEYKTTKIGEELVNLELKRMKSIVEKGYEILDNGGQLE